MPIIVSWDTVAQYDSCDLTKANFVGARKELQQALSTLEDEKILQEMVENNCYWVDFKMNVPEASHMGGSFWPLIKFLFEILSSKITFSLKLITVTGHFRR